MKILFAIMMILTISVSCQRSRRVQSPDKKQDIKVLKAARIVAPDDGLKVRSAPGDSAKSIADLPKNTRVRVIEFSREAKGTDGKAGQWAKIEFEKDSEIMTGWVHNDFLSPLGIIGSEGARIDPELLKKDTGPAGRIIGKFMLVHCEYNPGYAANPYLFLGNRKQYFLFNTDGSCSFDINSCAGSSSEDGAFSQEARSLTAAMGGERILIEIINSNSLRVTKGSGFLSCHVCREIILMRTAAE